MCTRNGVVSTILLLTLFLLPACGGGGSAGTTAKPGASTVDTNPPGHQGGGSGGGGGEPQDEISQMRALWESQGITSYEYVLQRSSFSPQNLVEPVIIQVRAGQVVSRTYVKTGLPATAGGPTWWPAIDVLFDELESARDGGADTIEVTWNSQYGYPSHAFVDYISGAADDERALTISSFTPHR